MLVEFKVKNFRSFKDEVVLSMVADSNGELSEKNTFQAGNMTLLKVAAIFGANASGKSNLLKSINFFNELFKDYIDIDNLYSSLPFFKLNEENEALPISFEITWIKEGIRHRYGLEIQEEGIKKEWLFFAPNKQEACYFVRDGIEITKTGTYFKEKASLEYIRPDIKRPFLYTLAQKSINGFDWAKDINLNLSFNLWEYDLADSTFKILMERALNQELISKDIILQKLKNADLGVTNFTVEKVTEAFDVIQKSDKQEIENTETYLYHDTFDELMNVVGEAKFPISEESTGTYRLYCLLCPILIILRTGGSIFVDEIEKSLHPLLCEKIVRMFNDNETNPNNAQLIFTTHNTLLMRSDLLRRDQIYFTEKDKYGCSRLYSLYDIDLDIRSNYNYMNNYLSGRFGAVPYLDSFDFMQK